MLKVIANKRKHSHNFFTTNPPLYKFLLLAVLALAAAELATAAAATAGLADAPP